MKRVGICTMYYENPNYGGNLQAYALQKMVNSMGFRAEMISYYNGTRLHRRLSKLKHSFIGNDSVSRNVQERRKTIAAFTQSIPHSKLYYVNTIYMANAVYDGFITGSDQVWNPKWVNAFTSLHFAAKDKTTVAYAASIGKIKLSHEEGSKLSRAIANTKYISIREKESIPALQELTDRKIESALDPTLLYTGTEWNAICSDRLIDEDYLFCYFLRGNENLRKTAVEYAKRRGLKLVSLPFLNGAYRAVDDKFGDYALYNVSPQDFLSLIRYASFVMTDSFHAVVFSHLYGTEFIASSEYGNEMGCRQKSLTTLFGTEERYIEDHEMVTMDKLLALERIPLNIKWNQYESERQKSVAFLKEALENV